MTRKMLITRIARKRCRQGESGSVLVETALTLVFFVALMIALIELSMIMYSFHYLSNAAREGSRYAIVRGYDWATACPSGNYLTVGGGCYTSTADIQSYIQNLGFPGINGSNISVTVGCATTPGGAFSNAFDTTCIGATTSNVQAGVVQVSVSYPFSWGLNLPYFNIPTWTLTSTSEMTIAQ